MDNSLSIQWFPGHMTKAKRKIQQNLKLVDAVAEIIDARIPVSSVNPDFEELFNSKPKIMLLNKSDIADSNETSKWISFYKNSGLQALSIDCKSGKNLNKFIPATQKALKKKIDTWNSKGMVGRTIRVMVVGIPNVGKSSFINKMVKSHRAKVEDRPGVTRGQQWFTLTKGFELLDTPGVLWPKIDDDNKGMNLAFTGAVKDQVIDTYQLSISLLDFLRSNYPAGLISRFKLDESQLSLDGIELLNLIGKKRGMLISGGDIDLDRVTVMILDEFRAGKLGKITLEKLRYN